MGAAGPFLDERSYNEVKNEFTGDLLVKADMSPLPRVERRTNDLRTAPQPSSERLQRLGEHFRLVRSFTAHLTQPLATEDYVVQTMQDVSPTKWHLAHTTWFFEVFLLQRFKRDYRLHHPDYPFLFNSYYVQAGERHCRDRRGYISRPTVSEIYAYRAYVEEQVDELIEEAPESSASGIADVLEIGIHHEQQHQELILTDMKHVLSVNPLRPVYRETAAHSGSSTRPPKQDWVHFSEGLHEIGHHGDGFCFDNEMPRHRHFIHEFLLSNRLVTNGEYLEFMEDGGYRRPELWLSEGWATAEEHHWTEPFYWESREGRWWTFTLGGMRKVDENEPVCHLSYFEADAFARWAGARLPTEFEWEHAAHAVAIEGNFVETARVHPVGTTAAGNRNGSNELLQLYGDVWEWTRSQYSPYPGYKPLPGALGEYNGKFMCNQFVLRGGSCATSRSHIRPTYRNFFAPASSWQFTGVRLAQDI